MSDSELWVGLAEVDITPAIGVRMLGGFSPRQATATADPLISKALVARSGGKQVALVGVDLALLPRDVADPAISEAARRTGIPAAAIMISATHTHTGPDTSGVFFPDALDAEYMAALPGKIASSIVQAQAALQPASMHIGRSLVYHGIHHRRVICKKDGKAMNTWMPDFLNDLDACPQVLGAAGPVDPELWVVRFDDAQGQPFGILVNFSAHANSHGGLVWSADYPAVIAEYMRAAYGPQVISVYLPGACGNTNPTMGGPQWRKFAESLGEQAVAAAKRAIPIPGPIAVDAERVDLLVPRIDPAKQPVEAITRLNWGRGQTLLEYFQVVSDRVAATPEMYPAPVGVARLGPLGIAGQPGEAFVEEGLQIKKLSPFPYTIIAELNNDDIGYQPTPQAFDQEGYEPLVGASRVSKEGIVSIVAKASAMLDELWARGGGR